MMAANTPNNTPPKERKKAKLTPQMEERKWKPGQSGNPSGRPKKKPVTEMLEKIFEEHPEEIEAQIIKVFKGKSGMAKVMLLNAAADRIEGKVSQPIEGSLELSLSLSERMKKARERVGE